MQNSKFLVITLLLAIAMGSALPIYNALVSHPAMVKLLRHNTEQSAVKTAHHIVENFLPLKADTFSKPLSPAQQNSILQLKKNYGLTRVKVFDPSGRIIFSTRSQDIGDINKKDYFHHKVARGETVNKLVNKKQQSMEGVEVNRDVAEIYIPVMMDKTFVGAFEFYFDITEQKTAIDSLADSSFNFLLLVTVGFLSLFGFVGVRMRQAVKKQIRAEQEITQLAYNDTLTGLPNRRLFMNRLEHALKQTERHDRKVALLYMDIDHFKAVNDTLGHDQGDILLRSITERMSEHVRKSDTLARLGGDEFVFLFTSLHQSEEAATIARTILGTFEKPFNLDGHDFFITPSIGIAVYPEDGISPGILLKHADIAMYSAKQKGRNTYACFSHEMDQIVQERHEIEHCLRNALTDNQFSLVYQPQLDLKSGRIVGAEALLRWHHPEKGLIPPDQFIPVAEKTGLIGPIGEWVLAEACRQNAAWAKTGHPPLRIAVNLSAYQLKQPDFIKTVDRILSETGMPQHLLELELTESLAMDDTATNIETLNNLRELGIHLSIDDFGTGYSSLSYLSDLPIHRVKIDRSFIGRLAEGSHSSAIVDAIIAMARSLGLIVIAEGVETQPQLDFLKSRDCDIIQGYFSGRPVPAKEFSALLKEMN